MPDSPRFLQLADVAEILNTSSAQVYALVRRRDLKAIKIGGRGQWRVEASELESYIQRMYADAERFIDEHPFSESDPGADGPADLPARLPADASADAGAGDPTRRS
jgi:excisionase family DNA binding protein